MGSVSAIPVSGLSGCNRQMDKFLYRQKNTGFRQSDRLTVGRPDRDVIACHYAGSLTDAMPGLVEKAGGDVVP